MAEDLTLRSVLKKIEELAENQNLTADEEQFLVSKIDNYWDNHPDVNSEHPVLRKILAWVCGYQYYDINTKTKLLQKVPLDKERKLTFNKLRGFFRTFVGKLVADAPQMGVLPGTTDDDDKETSLLADRIVEALSHKIGFQHILVTLKKWLVLAAKTYLRVFWNEDQAGYVGKVELKDETTGEVQAIETEEPGDVDMEVLSPFMVRTDPLNADWKNWRWAMFGREMDAEAVEEKYGLENGTLKQADKSKVVDTTIQDNENRISAPDMKDDIRGRTALYFEFWTPRVYIYTAGGKVLKYGTHDLGGIPIFKSEDVLVPLESQDKGIQYNISVFKDLIPIQKEYNRRRSIMSQALERQAKMKVLVPIGSMTSPKQMDDDFGWRVDYDPRMGGEPHQMRNDPMPPESFNDLGTLSSEMMDAGSLREGSFGRLPERASHASGNLLSLLLEQDDVIMNPMLASLNDMLGRAWSMALRIVQARYSIDRTIKYVGADSMPAAIKFQGADLKGCTDVIVTSQMGLPRSRALKVEYVMRLRNAGLIKDDRQAMQMLQFPDLNKMFYDSMLHESRAKRENEQIQQNDKIDPMAWQTMVTPYDDSPVHMEQHVRERLSPRFDGWNQNQKDCLEGMIQYHQQKIQEAQAAAAQQAAVEAQAKSGAKVSPARQTNEPQAQAPQGQPGPGAKDIPQEMN